MDPPSVHPSIFDLIMQYDWLSIFSFQNHRHTLVLKDVKNNTYYHNLVIM